MNFGGNIIAVTSKSQAEIKNILTSNYTVLSPHLNLCILELLDITDFE